ncbi:MAG: protoheme IX farnesyltransferase [Cytophagales bacterium]|nr:MAG: protoheme IX farnesyltransferase [Cytophagales bacterium]TAF60386.1 MAG: protoheme IX farnesyltransferase [Cytophagales bacterium]
MLNPSLSPNAQTSSDWWFKLKQFWIMSKPRLSGLVIFSAAFGYALGATTAIDWLKMSVFCLGSFMITAAANSINQIIEKDLDKLMTRTQGRPLPMSFLEVQEAVIFILLMSILGSALVYWASNLTAMLLGLFSLFLYGFVYTPLKQKNAIAVFVGAFPGAFPPLIGWVAATESFSLEIWIIFGIQFIWQFPHFWAIAWVGDEDYRKAGFRLLPGGEKTTLAAIQIAIYTLLLIPTSFLPWRYGLCSVTSVFILAVSSVLFLIPAIWLIKDGSRKAALTLMFASFIYLPVVQITIFFTEL